jgi:hypothetical protein
VSAAFVFFRFWSATCRYCHCLFLLFRLWIRFNLMIFINFNSITKLFCKVKLLDRFFSSFWEKPKLLVVFFLLDRKKFQIRLYIFLIFWKFKNFPL